MSQLEVRIYYEDTDHGGVVYHANYLKYMERGRTEALRNLGFEQTILAEESDAVFAVRHTDIYYLRPAVFDDLVTIATDLVEAKGAKMVFKQRVLRQAEVLVEADIVVACISKAGKPKRIPKALLGRIEQEQS